MLTYKRFCEKHRIESVTVSPAHAKIVRERTKGFLEAALLYSCEDLNVAVRSAIYSAYIQGLQDGHSATKARLADTSVANRTSENLPSNSTPEPRSDIV